MMNNTQIYQENITLNLYAPNMSMTKRLSWILEGSPPKVANALQTHAHTKQINKGIFGLSSTTVCNGLCTGHCKDYSNIYKYHRKFWIYIV